MPTIYRRVLEWPLGEEFDTNIPLNRRSSERGAIDVTSHLSGNCEVIFKPGHIKVTYVSRSWEFQNGPLHIGKDVQRASTSSSKPQLRTTIIFRNPLRWRSCKVLSTMEGIVAAYRTLMRPFLSSTGPRSQINPHEGMEYRSLPTLRPDHGR